MEQEVSVTAAEAERPTRTEDGRQFPASDYAYIPDPNRPSTWKLRLTSEPGGPPDPRIVGAAVAALGPGFRGNRVEVPEEDLPEVKRRVRRAWLQAHPDAGPDEVPDAIREAEGSVELHGDPVPLVERASRRGGRLVVKLISPGQGSSGYYSADVLRRDGPRVFRQGTHVFIDHPTAEEEASRPERSLRDLAGVLTTDARWEEHGPAGPGLYAEARLRPDLVPFVREVAPYIGVSIRALGTAAPGEVDGRPARVVRSLDSARSVDLVTVAGAGGRVVDLLEAARRWYGGVEAMEHLDIPGEDGSPVPGPVQEPVREAVPQGHAGLPVEQEVARLRETVALLEAREVVHEALAGVNLPKPTRERLAGLLVGNPPVVDGVLDRVALSRRIDEAVREETAYLARVMGTGYVRGVSPPAVDAVAPDERLRRAFSRVMGSDQLAGTATVGRR